MLHCFDHSGGAFKGGINKGRGTEKRGRTGIFLKNEHQDHTVDQCKKAVADLNNMIAKFTL